MSTLNFKNMKLVKVLVMCCLCSATFSVNAQSWKNALKKGIKEAIETKNKAESPQEELNVASEATKPQQSDINFVLMLSNTEIPLTVLGEGTTQEEAMNDATNDAIGQVNAAFSASVSADIIKRSKVLTSCTTPDGKIYVPMRFVIDGSQWLADTPEGASSGLASFGNGFKKEELYKTNNLQILNDLLVPIGKLLPVAFERMV